MGKNEHLKYPISFQREQWRGRFSKVFWIFRRTFSTETKRHDAPYERLYSRPADHFVGMPVYHFKKGPRPKNYKFMVALFKQIFKCTSVQFTHNSIQLMIWFIAACNQHKRQTTFMAFFSIFSIKKTNSHPFYELLRIKTIRIGKASSNIKLVIFPRSSKNWQWEFIMLRSGDWEYMSGFENVCNPLYVI